MIACLIETCGGHPRVVEQDMTADNDGTPHVSADILLIGETEATRSELRRMVDELQATEAAVQSVHPVVVIVTDQQGAAVLLDKVSQTLDEIEDGRQRMLREMFEHIPREIVYKNLPGEDLELPRLVREKRDRPWEENRRQRMGRPRVSKGRRGR